MAINFTSDIMSSFNTLVGADANYESPGNFGLTSNATGLVGVDHATITTPGTYTTVPTSIATPIGGTIAATFQTLMKFLVGSTIPVAGTGYHIGSVLTLVGGTLYPGQTAATATVSHVKLASATVAAPGTGVAPADVLTLTAGTGTTATATVNTTQLITVAGNSPGTIYVPGDHITLAGGTSTAKAVVVVATVLLASATVHAAGGGTGYGNAQTFNVTVAGGIHGAAATVNVTTNVGGVVTTINSVSAAGSYTVLPTLSGNAATGDNGADHGTGLLLDLVFGVNTVTVTTPGSYSVNTATFTQFSTTSVAGTGATFQTASYGALTVTPLAAGDYTVLLANPVATTGDNNDVTLTALWGVKTVTISNASKYSALPANPISVTGGTGTGAQFTGSWGIDSLVVLTPGSYEVAVPPTIVFGSGSGAATAVLATATDLQTDTQKLLMIVEIIRSFVAEFNTPSQAKDVHEVIRKMLAEMRFGAPTNFDATAMAVNVLGAAMNYIAKNPTHGGANI